MMSEEQNKSEVVLEEPGGDKEDIDVAGFKKTVFGAAIGNLIEWFDYATYGYLATVIATVFFAPGDKTAALLSTFAVFAVSFVVRPLGGIVWGYYGDKLGRKKILVLTVIIMSLATFSIGLIPGYASIGKIGRASCRERVYVSVLEELWKENR